MVLKVGLLASPLALLVAPLVGAGLDKPVTTSSRVAIAFAVVLLLVFLARALTRSPREALALLAATTIASSAAAHIIVARENLFFVADLLYEASAALLAGASVGAGLRLARFRNRNLADGRWSPSQREVADGTTQLSAVLLLMFWACVVAGLRYASAGVLVILAGTVAVTVLLRLAELAAIPPSRARGAVHRP